MNRASPPRYRAVIVGCNWIAATPPPAPFDPALPAPMPPSHAAAYAAMPEVELTAVCDASQAALDEFRKHWAATWPAVRVYTDYAAMLERERPDIVSVCTPDDLHAPHVIAAAEAGVRGIFCEKPLATTLTDAERMLEAVRKHRVAFSVDVTRRWSPDYHQARTLVRAGRIGRLRLILATRGGPKGWFYRAGGHLFDLVCFFAESEPEWLVGELDEGYENFTTWRGGGPADSLADPGGYCYVHFANNVRASVSISRTLPHGYHLDLLGTRGRIRIDDARAELWQPVSEDSLDLARYSLPRQPHQASGILAGLQELVRLVETGEEGVSTGQDALRALKMILATVESNHRRGARIDMTELGA